MIKKTPQVEHLEREYDRLAAEILEYYKTIVATERFAVLGAAALAAFLYTDLPKAVGAQAFILAWLPFLVLVLAGLRCLSLFIGMLSAGKYLGKIEGVFLDGMEEFGIQRHHTIKTSKTLKMFVVTTSAFWLVACGAALVFWLTYTPLAT